MLAREEWSLPKVQPDVFSLESLMAWLETMPEKSYRYSDIDHCLLSQYFRAKGYRWAHCGPGFVSYSLFFLPPLFTKRIPRIMDDVAVSQPHTFGAALTRARAALIGNERP